MQSPIRRPTVALITFLIGIAISPVSRSPRPNVSRHLVVSSISDTQVTASPSFPKELLPVSVYKIISKNVTMENKAWRYQINADYPQIQGTNDPAIRKLNRHIKQLITKAYSWPLSRPSKDDLAYYAKRPGVFNSVNIEYKVLLNSDELLSIYFMGYHYGIGAAHSVHESFTLNYDFKSHRQLALADLFKPRANYLPVISQRCKDELSKDWSYLKTDRYFNDGLAPRVKNFESWNLTEHGLRLNFHACKIEGCSGGDLTVEIPFEELKDLLRINGPL